MHTILIKLIKEFVVNLIFQVEVRISLSDFVCYSKALEKSNKDLSQLWMNHFLFSHNLAYEYSIR